jgi:hypothetical protein
MGSTLGVNFGGMNIDAFSSDFTFNFMYTVNPDRTWTSYIMGTVTGKVTSGPRAGQQFTVDTLPDFKGHISQDAKTLTAATIIAPPTIETVTYLVGPPSVTEYRICQRSRTLIYVDQQ